MEEFDASTIIGEGGAFTEDWRETMFPGDEHKDIRENPTLANIKDLPTMARQVIDSQKQIGKITGGRAFAIIPNETSTPEEIEAYHTKLGRPATPEEYGFGEIENANPKFVEKMSKAAHAAGAPKAVADAMAKAYVEFGAEDQAEQITEGKIADAKADKQLRTEWGSAYDDKMKDAQIAITVANGIDPEFAKELNDMLPFNPSAAKFLAKLGGMLAEDPGLKGATGPAGGKMTPADALTKAKEIQSNNPYWATPDPVNLPRSVEQHKEAVAQYNTLFEIAYPT